MKSEKGITMVSLITYIVLIFIAVGILATIRANFQTGIDEMNNKASYNSEYNKLNLYLLEDIKKEGNTITEIGNTFIEFSSENRYEFKQSDNAIYKINSTKVIRIANNIETCSFTTSMQEEKTIITISFKIIGIDENKTNEYVLGYGNAKSTYENEENYISTKTYNLSEVILAGTVTQDLSYEVSLQLSGLDASLNPISETKNIYLTEPLRKIEGVVLDELDVENEQIKRYISIGENNKAIVLLSPQIKQEEQNITFPTSDNIVGEITYSIVYNN